jgi:hypothetical protein
VVVVLGRADEGTGVPFQPLREAIGHWAAHAGDAELALLGEGAAEQLARIVPALAERRRPDALLSIVGDGADRQRLFEAITRWIEVLAARQPAVVVLEDLHWADPATVLAVRHVLRHPPAVGALLLATHRDNQVGANPEVDRLLAETRREPYAHHARLEGLVDGDAAELLRGRAGGDLNPAGRQFAAQLNRMTGGNPFFIIETLRHLTERGVIDPDAGRWASPPFEVFGLPSAITDLIEQRLGRLPTPSSAILRPASVLGQHFDVPVLSQVVDMPQLAVIEALEPVVAARLITAEGPGADRFEFSHSLVRHAILDGVGLSHRARIHWRAGEAIASVSGANLQPWMGEIARHFAAGVHAGDPLAAIRANVEAGQLALSTLAFEEAAARFVTATGLLDTPGVVDDRLAYAAWMGLGQASGAVGDGGPQRAAYLQAVAIARRQRWAHRFAGAAIGFATYSIGGGRSVQDPPTAMALVDEALAALADSPTVDRCLLLTIQVVRGVAREESAGPRELAASIDRLALAVDDPAVAAAAALARAWTLIGTALPDELADAAACAMAPVDHPLARRFLNLFTVPVLPIPALQRGDREGFEAIRDGLASEPEVRSSAHASAYVTTWDAAVALCRGRFDDVERLHATSSMAEWPVWQSIGQYQADVAHYERGTQPNGRPAAAAYVSSAPHSVTARTTLALLHAQAGDHLEARRQVEILRQVRPLDQLGWGAPRALRQLAELAVRVDDADLAADLLPVLSDYGGQLLVSFTGMTIDGAADRAIGQVLVALGRVDEAIGRYAAAAALEECFGAEALAVRTAYWHAHALRRRGAPGDDEAADDLLRHASSLAHRLGMAQLGDDIDTLARR